MPASWTAAADESSRFFLSWGSQVLITAFPIAAILLCIMSFETPLAVVVVAVPAVYAVGVTLLVTFNTSSGELAPAQSKATFLSRYLTVNDLGSSRCMYLRHRAYI